METMKKNDEKKKGILASILESMVKTGGCCGAGESCGGEAAPSKSKQDDNKKDEQNESGKK